MAIYILSSILRTFRHIGIYPDSEIKLQKSNKDTDYDEVMIKYKNSHNYYMFLKNGFYPSSEIKICFFEEKEIFLFFINSKNKYHRKNGPAVITYNKKKDGSIGDIISEKFFLNGLLHRKREPAVIKWTAYDDGTRGGVKHLSYHKNDRLHRKNGPAIILYEENFYGTQGNITFESYYIDGRQHRDNNPAEIYYEKNIIIKEVYYSYNKIHRINNPAIIIFSINDDGSQGDQIYTEFYNRGRYIQ